MIFGTARRFAADDDGTPAQSDRYIVLQSGSAPPEPGIRGQIPVIRGVCGRRRRLIGGNE